MSGDAKVAYFNDLAPRWDQMPWPEDVGERVAAFCERACPAGARLVLDVGCGTGLLLAPLTKRLDREARVVELDFALAMLAEVGRKPGDGRVRRVCADARALPFPEGLFDAVLCFGILPHLGEARRAVGKLWRAVRPGGVLAVGHLMGSRELNAKHQSFGGPVGEDFLPAAGEVAEILRALGAVAVETEEAADRYFVRGER